MPHTPVITTQRLRLRPHAASDFKALHALWNDTSVTEMITGHPSTEAESWGRLLKYAGHWSVLGYGYWAVENKETGEYLGEVGLADYRRGIAPEFDGNPEAGWIFAKHAQGKGYAREAMRGVLDWADRSLVAEKSVCMIIATHARSIRLAQELGFNTFGSSETKDSILLLFERARNTPCSSGSSHKTAISWDET